MDYRAAKGIAANIRIIAQATALSVSPHIDEENKQSAQATIARAEQTIAEWLQQPMTWRKE